MGPANFFHSHASCPFWPALVLDVTHPAPIHSSPAGVLTERLWKDHALLLQGRSKVFQYMGPSWFLCLGGKSNAPPYLTEGAGAQHPAPGCLGLACEAREGCVFFQARYPSLGSERHKNTILRVPLFQHTPHTAFGGTRNYHFRNKGCLWKGGVAVG